MDYKTRRMINHKKFTESKPWAHRLQDIKYRCNNVKCKRFKNYGGRGIECRITVEELKNLWFRDKAWLLNDATLDREDNDGHYEFNNCRFIERSKNSSKDKICYVLQFDKNNNFIKEWDNPYFAHKSLKIPHQNIYEALKNIRKSAGGFIWKYKLDIS